MVTFAVNDLEIACNKGYDAYSRFQLALVYEAMGDLPKVELNLRKSIKLDPDFVPAVQMLSAILLQKSQTDPEKKEEQRKLIDEVISLIQQTINRVPKDKDLRVQLAQAYLLIQQDEKALELLEEEVKLFPDNPSPYVLRLQISLRNKDWDVAVVSLKKLIALKPKQPGLRLDLGKILFGMGQKDNAIQYLEEENRLFPNDSTTLVWLWIYYHLNGQEAKAAALKETALKSPERKKSLEKKFEDAEELLMKLKESSEKEDIGSKENNENSPEKKEMDPKEKIEPEEKDKLMEKGEPEEKDEPHGK
jgi:predicted Zn-dependent protease